MPRLRGLPVPAFIRQSKPPTEGLGILASAIYTSREAFAAAIDRIQSLTDRPFAVNINLFPSMRPIDNDEYVD